MIEDPRIPVLMARIAYLEAQLAKRDARDILDLDMFCGIKKIAEYIARQSGVPLMDIRSNRKDYRAARMRQVVMYLARIHTDYSLPKIGRYVKRDHTSVMHGIKRIKELMETNSELKTLVEGFNRESPE